MRSSRLGASPFGRRGGRVSNVLRVWGIRNQVTLSNYRVAAAVAVSDMARARGFYEGKLGLIPDPEAENEGNVRYVCGEGSLIHVFVSPYAGTAQSTVAGWGVDDIESVVGELAAKGVVFEQYDEPGLLTDERGIATFEGDAKVAYLKDPDGNVLSIAQAPR
jgi:catechol 2,3-dioxygenase-like lactoylglutathione lyase family enzyme